MKLLGQTCIITGASRGFGSSLAQRFWAEGASLLLVARSNAGLAEVSESLGKPGHAKQSFVLLPCDLREREAAAKIFRAAHEVFAQLTVLINNAAILGPVGCLSEISMEDFEETMRVNLLAAAALCAQAAAWMKRQGYGKIINVSGGGAASPRPNFSAYAVAKAGLVRLTEALAQELQGSGVYVNAIAPGMMDTAMTRAVVAAGTERAGGEEVERAAACGRNGNSSATLAVELALFLASAESDGISGRLISARWDDWKLLPAHIRELEASDAFTLRRILPRDRGFAW